MSTLFIVLHLLVGRGHHRHWATFKHHELTTQSMLCNDRAKHMRDEAPTLTAGRRMEIWCRKEMAGA